MANNLQLLTSHKVNSNHAGCAVLPSECGRRLEGFRGVEWRGGTMETNLSWNTDNPRVQGHVRLLGLLQSLFANLYPRHNQTEALTSNNFTFNRVLYGTVDARVLYLRVAALRRMGEASGESSGARKQRKALLRIASHRNLEY